MWAPVAAVWTSELEPTACNDLSTLVGFHHETLLEVASYHLTLTVAGLPRALPQAHNPSGKGAARRAASTRIL